MVQAASLASIITPMETTRLAAKLVQRLEASFQKSQTLKARCTESHRLGDSEQIGNLSRLL